MRVHLSRAATRGLSRRRGSLVRGRSDGSCARIAAAPKNDRPAADNADRWSNTVFSSPRALHFHTCGAYAPGEICWMVIDPTITLDGAPLWRAGALNPAAHPAVAAVVAAHPALGPLCARPPAPIGV